MDNFRGGAIAMLMPATTRLGRFQNFADTHLVALACAVMFASAVALPSFSSSALGLKGLYKITLSLFMFSAVSFGLMHRTEIKDNIGPGLAVCLPTAFAALLTLRPSLEDFASYIPISAAISTMVITYLVPWARKSFRAWEIPSGITIGDLIRAGHRSGFSGSDGASVGSHSTRSSVSNRSSGFRLWIGTNPDSIELAHVGHVGEYDLAAVPPFREAMSISDLESGLHPGSSQASIASIDSTDRLLV
ncbi:hypothetical protein IFR04_000410 [Cadophora malorum]|uniref:Uncharacterized protein n=1 Tax=Cadophora malorum TaxID=108018 RepID=A0A8H7WKV8_9HELO|nr:hypothetical protein IFR04_000410 [Cadophora malorum]